MPMGLVYDDLVKANQLKGGQGEEEKEKDQEKCSCQYHGRTMDHFIQECPEFLRLVQEMMNKRKMEFCGKMEEPNVSILLKEVPKPVTILY